MIRSLLFLRYGNLEIITILLFVVITCDCDNVLLFVKGSIIGIAMCPISKQGNNDTMGDKQYIFTNNNS